MTPKEKLAPYAFVIVHLLKGPIYSEDKKSWQGLQQYQHSIRAYFEQIGIDLVFNEAEGFAFLKHFDDDPDDNFSAPRLVVRMPLSYEVTLLCVLLRETLENFDTKDTDSHKLFVSRGELKEQIGFFFKDKANRVKLLGKFDNYIKAVQRYGFLTPVNSSQNSNDDAALFEVKRIIKAKITNEKLEEIKSKLAGHADTL